MRKLTKVEIQIIQKRFEKTKNLINDIITYTEKYGKVQNTLEQDIQFAKLVIAQKYQ